MGIHSGDGLSSRESMACTHSGCDCTSFVPNMWRPKTCQCFHLRKFHGNKESLVQEDKKTEETKSIKKWSKKAEERKIKDVEQKKKKERRNMKEREILHKEKTNKEEKTDTQ